MHLARHQHVLAQQVVQRLQQLADRTGSALQRCTAQLHALPTVYFRLAVVRRVFEELRRDDARQQAGQAVFAGDRVRVSRASFNRSLSIFTGRR